MVTSRPANARSISLAATVPSNISGNRIVCYFGSILFFSLNPLINKPESSRDLTISMVSSIFLLEIINYVVTGP